MPEDREDQGGTQPPDESTTDPGAGSPVPDRDKEADVPAPGTDDQLPAPTPGM